LRGSTTLWGHINAFLSRPEIPLEDIKWHLFLRNMKGLSQQKTFICELTVVE
jgi:hypothetical protein